MKNVTRKKRPSNDTSVRDRLYRAGLDMIASAGWHATTMEKIARQAKIPLSRATGIFPDRYALAQALADDIKAQTSDALGTVDATLSLRDLVFDALMARFDILQRERTVILALVDAAKTDRRLAMQGLTSTHAAMRQILVQCGRSTHETRDKWLLFGLMALYARGLCAWRRDQSADLSATMAALGRMMDRVEKLASLL